MPPELPGFYYDAEKNRYFPIKGPIPGTSRSRSLSSSSSTVDRKSKSNSAQATIKPCKAGARTSKLLQARELNGNVLSLIKGKCNFKEEYQKRLASQPVVWNYQGTNNGGDSALEHIHTMVKTCEGQFETDFLLTGSANGSLSFFEVGNIGQRIGNYWVENSPDLVWPLIEKDKAEYSKAPQHIWIPNGPSIHMISSVSSIKLCGKRSLGTTDDGSDIQRVFWITTLGSAASGGSVYVLNLSDPLDFRASISIVRQRINEVASFDCTIWTADCSANASQAVIGTNLGAALVNLETGMASWVCRSKSDVLAQQLDHSGNIVLCGLRNGAIVTVDVRERQSRLIKHPITYSQSHRSGQRSNRRWFELRGNISPSRTIFMPSSISSLVSLRSYDQYLLASSMDGTIKLYDHRLTKRGAVQSYEGHVNSHTPIQLGVDQSERFIISGGEDCNVRLWSIKSGELLFENKFSDSIPSTVCWRRSESLVGAQDRRESEREFGFRENDSSSEAWIGTREGLFRMQWS